MGQFTFDACQSCRHSALWFSTVRCWELRHTEWTAVSWRGFLVLYISKPPHSEFRLESGRVAPVQLECRNYRMHSLSTCLFPPLPLCPSLFLFLIMVLSLFLLLQNLKTMAIELVVRKWKWTCFPCNAHCHESSKNRCGVLSFTLHPSQRTEDVFFFRLMLAEYYFQLLYVVINLSHILTIASLLTHSPRVTLRIYLAARLSWTCTTGSAEEVWSRNTDVYATFFRVDKFEKWQFRNQKCIEFRYF